MKKNKKILYLLNPLSNEGRALSFWKEAQKHYKMLPKNPFLITEIKNLKDFLKKENPDIVAIAGGDGTINAVVNAIMQRKTKPILAALPLGFGNAVASCLGVETMEKALSVLRKQQDVIAVDVMKTNIADRPYGLFNISMGFDARIVFNRMRDRYIGLRSYIISAMKSYISHPEQKLTITVDNKFIIRATASSLVIANCPIIGHNYLVSPYAKLNDGFLDCTLFSSKYAYMTNLRLRGFKHPLYSEVGKMHFKATTIKIDGDPFVQVDGDPFVRQEGIEITIKPRAIRVLRNIVKEKDQYHEPFIV